MKAGYKGNSNVLAQIGHKNLVTNGKIKAELAKRTAVIEAKTEISIELCTQRFNDIYNKAIADDDKQAAIKANENHGKHLGYYELDNSQKSTKLAIAIRNEQSAIDKQIATLKALDDAPDALAL